MAQLTTTISDLPQAIPIAQNIQTLTKSQKLIDMVDLTNLWRVLGMIYGRRFWSCFGQHPNMVWLKVLEKLTVRELHYGMLRLFSHNTDSHDGKQAWPPNAKEFLMLCRYQPADFGLLGVDEAFQTARNSLNRPYFIWPHVCVYLAADEVGAMRLTEDTPQNYYAFKYCYELVAQRAMSGVDLGEAPNRGVMSDVALQPSNTAVAIKYIQDCFDTLHGRKSA